MVDEFRKHFREVCGRRTSKVPTYNYGLIDIAKLRGDGEELPMTVVDAPGGGLIREWGLFYMHFTNFMHIEYVLGSAADIVDYLNLLRHMIKDHGAVFDDDGYLTSGKLTRPWYYYFLQTNKVPLKKCAWVSLCKKHSGTVEELYHRLITWAENENARLGFRNPKTDRAQIQSITCHSFVVVPR